ncbi:Tm-1-like ATP-binding domain-containing protein [Pseudonocardia sichuanensis]
MNVVLVGALDTKHAEYGFVRDRLVTAGVACLLVDTSVLGPPGVEPDVDRRTVAAAGGAEHEALVTAGDRNAAVSAMARGAAAVVERLHAEGRVAGVVVLGGSNAGFVMSRVAPALPIGVPKVLVSTVVAGDTRPYVGTSDLTMIYPVVDIAGLNSISTPVLARAADALAGMVTGPPVPADPARPAVGATMFGVTTACVQAVGAHLERRGAETHVFHCTGTGGRTFEAMIASGAFAAVVDVTTTELADELVGGVCTAGPHRLEAAAAHGVPQVVSVGALDMVNFGPRDTVPAEHTGRRLLAHNPSVTLMRTSAAENAELGRIIAGKLAGARGLVEVHVPRRGFSQVSAPGGPFHDPDADAALLDSLAVALDPRIPLHVHDVAINDPAFARHLGAAADRALSSTTKGT